MMVIRRRRMRTTTMIVTTMYRIVFTRLEEVLTAMPNPYPGTLCRVTWWNSQAIRSPP